MALLIPIAAMRQFAKHCGGSDGMVSFPREPCCGE
jgi:hypothetical protein